MRREYRGRDPPGLPLRTTCSPTTSRARTPGKDAMRLTCAFAWCPRQDSNLRRTVQETDAPQRHTPLQA